MVSFSESVRGECLSKIPSPSEIRKTRDTIPTEKLVRWAEASGFEIRTSGGGSHIIYRHKEFPDIGNNFVYNTSKWGSQRSFANCLEQLAERREQLAKTFRSSAEDSLYRYYKSLPPHLTVEHDFENARSVVRDRHLPQIGVTIKFEDARLLENKIRFLEDNKRDAYILLNRHNISLKSSPESSGERVLFHPVYSIPPVALQRYEAGSKPTSFFEKISEFIQSVSEKDNDHASRMKAILSHDFVKSATVSLQCARGTRQNSLTCETPSGSTIVISFTSHSNRRFRSEDDISESCISSKALAALEARINGLASAHLRAA